MFINDIFKKKQITEANVKKPQPYNEPGWTRKLSKQELDAIAGTKDFDKPSKDKKDKQKKQDVKEAGPFSYGARSLVKVVWQILLHKSVKNKSVTSSQ